jgi:hypothetical protein
MTSHFLIWRLSLELREQRRQGEHERASDGRRRCIQETPDDRQLRGQPAQDDEAGREGRDASDAQGCEHRDRGPQERTAHDDQENEARVEVIRKRTSLERDAGNA